VSSPRRTSRGLPESRRSSATPPTPAAHRPRPGLAPSSPDEQLTDILGKSFVDAFLTFKRNALTRFHKHLTDWQFRAYAQIN
jgi:glutamine synthetase